MKRFLITLSAICAFAFNAQAQLNIATLDINECLANYHLADDASDVIRNIVSLTDSDIERLVEDGRTLVEEFEAKADDINNNPLLTDAAREELEAEAIELQQQIRQKQAELDGVRREGQRTVQEVRGEQMQILSANILEAANAVVAEQGIDILLNASDATGIGVGFVLYSTDTIDITPMVIERINADAPEGWVPGGGLDEDSAEG